ncbi:MAG: hypothetical protein KDI07_15155 [Anaerolineae bacterium]|nr:hypothetical protein [Anaerolineae bacterium]MCB9143274.1 hypothetical protein [Anaerolineales bacterium]MCB0227937.1 hypothetical protein [Anaerolineae bacterium]MCB0232808.1 hypothetical protein [Anaerolineae bacterium]MCB0237135.1 hypothetical protein [Anaerolineae bacterium]
MAHNTLEQIFEHNTWANLQIIRACYALSDEQLDATPDSATKGSIRETLLHQVGSQVGYLALLTLPPEKRPSIRPAFDELEQSVHVTGKALVDLVRHESTSPSETWLRTTNGYEVAPWVVLLQAINHATEHREQIKSMLSALGITPPDIDGWTFGQATGALIPTSS